MDAAAKQEALIARASRDPKTYAIIGAAMEVHRRLGHGFLEAVYAKALAIELRRLEIPFQQEVILPIEYRGERLDLGYRVDLICQGDVLVELKALATLGESERSQVLNYLKASGLRVALLLNFGAPSLEMQRFVF